MMRDKTYRECGFYEALDTADWKFIWQIVTSILNLETLTCVINLSSCQAVQYSKLRGKTL